MRANRRTTGSLLGLLTMSVLLAAGCGGGGQEPSGEQQGGQGGGANRAEPADSKIAIGTIRAVNEDKMRLSLEPATEDQGSGPIPFKLNKRTEVSLDGQERELGDARGGQQAQVEYVERDQGIDRAISVELFAAGGQQ